MYSVVIIDASLYLGNADSGLVSQVLAIFCAIVDVLISPNWLQKTSILKAINLLESVFGFTERINTSLRFAYKLNLDEGCFRVGMC